MGFENKTIDELIKLAKAGLGFSLNIHCFSAEQIQRITDAANEGGAKITLIDETPLQKK